MLRRIHLIAALGLWSAVATAAWAGNRVKAGWLDADVRHTLGETIKPLSAKTVTLTAWRGERVSALLMVNAEEEADGIRIETEGMDGISVHAAFVDYVMTDGLKPDGSGGCGYRKAADYDSSMVADIIDTEMRTIKMAKGDTRTCWLSIDVPQGAKAGTYKGTVKVSGTEERLGLNIKVVDRVLPAPADWKFHLDLWQNPYAVARYYNVEPFSAEHFELMRPVMQHYADAGGKAITASITHKPWNGQTYDPFESMVTWVKRADGTWLYDYTTFDRWVEFMMSLGVKGQISCYSMVPWRLSFQYLDGATNTLRFIQCKPGEKEYADFWGTMLKDFARHLKSKGWFGITHIAMDERSLPDMLATLKVIKDADPDFKVSLAGTYHEELVAQLDDYCITLAEQFPAELLQERKAKGMVSTFYTCCNEREPNTFTFSVPAEAEWLAWHSAAEGLDGYLRWAFNSWVRDPLHDSRFTAWPAGDTYLVYPDGKTSIRMERLKEGIQQYEKVRILRQQLPVGKQKKIDEALKPFADYYSMPAAEAINKAKRTINSL